MVMDGVNVSVRRLVGLGDRPSKCQWEEEEICTVFLVGGLGNGSREVERVQREVKGV